MGWIILLSFILLAVTFYFGVICGAAIAISESARQMNEMRRELNKIKIDLLHRNVQ